jgi:tRNA (guanine-N7-)-methyltransferase
MFDVALAPPILYSRRLAWPVSWPAVFAREAPLLLEIGFGNGQFLVELAAARPEANVLGLEISQPALRRAARRAQARGVHNLRLVYGPARQFLWSNCAPGSVSEVYINFPDPWPKAAHYHRRLISSCFLNLLATRLTAGGLLDIATDHPDYAEVIAALLDETPHFDSRRPVSPVAAGAARIRTKYEQKALAEGRRCHYFTWRRNEVSAPPSFPVPKELPMPHAILRSPLTLEMITTAFAATAHDGEGHIVRFIELFYGAGEGVLLVDTHVEEEPLAQRVALTIRTRGEEADDPARREIVVGLHELGFPRATPGVQAAVGYLTGWLLTLHPETELVNSNVPAGPLS